MHKKLENFILQNTPLIDEKLNSILAQTNAPSTLKSSMAYSINAGGKRIRPLLVLATLKDLGATSQDALTVACAAEFIHAYSLIHDDLPCMDDDDFRRGQPTNHKIYGDAVAVLAGDALQTLAFEVLSNLPNTPNENVLTIIRLLSKAAGAEGMVGGQMLDIEGEEKVLTIQEVEMIHLNKTGALLSFCIEVGAILANLENEQTNYIKQYARNIGLAFQIKDDILDITSTTEQLGKTVGSDESSDKSTYPALLGLDGAQDLLSIHYNLAIESLDFLENDQSLLKLFADYIVQRSL
jgi:geranylgeranyl diphosphate synthase type II